MSETMPTVYQIQHETILEYIRTHVEWSDRTFGVGDHTEGLLKHIQKEIEEVREISPYSITEWVDIIILAIDGAHRQGYSPMQIASMLIEKQNINANRKYPKITNPDEPTEHIQEDNEHS